MSEIIEDLIVKIDNIISSEEDEHWTSQIISLLADEGLLELPEPEVEEQTLIPVLVKCIRVGWNEAGDYQYGYSLVDLKIRFWEDIDDMRWSLYEKATMIWEGSIINPTMIYIPPPPHGRTYQFHVTWSDGVWHKRTPLLSHEPTEEVTTVNITHINR